MFKFVSVGQGKVGEQINVQLNARAKKGVTRVSLTDESLLSASKFVLFNLYFLLTFYLPHHDDEKI